MINKKRKMMIEAMDLEISKLQTELFDTDVNSENYDVIQHKLKVALDQRELLSSKKLTFSGDALLGAGVSILSLVAILKHEELNIITSKAFSIFTKGIK